MNKKALVTLINTVIYDEWEFQCPCEMLNEYFCPHHNHYDLGCSYKTEKRSKCKNALLNWIENKTADALNC